MATTTISRDPMEPQRIGGTYRIVRYSQNGPREVLYEGLTFDEVRAHCNNPATQGQGWFDGFEREE